MGKAKGVSKRRRKNKHPKFQRKSQLLKKRNKLLKRPKLEDQVLRKSYNPKLSIKANFKNFGLVQDPNELVPIPAPIESLIGLTKEEKIKLKQEKKEKKKLLKKPKTKIVEKMETDAKIKQPRTFCYGPDMCKFLSKMIEKYDKDYQAMQRDPENYYQFSAGQIRRRIINFTSFDKNYNAYLKAQKLCEEELNQMTIE